MPRNLHPDDKFFRHCYLNDRTPMSAFYRPGTRRPRRLRSFQQMTPNTKKPRSTGRKKELSKDELETRLAELQAQLNLLKGE